MAYKNCFIIANTDVDGLIYVLSDELVNNHVVTPEVEVNERKSQEKPDREDDASKDFVSNGNTMPELLEKHVLIATIRHMKRH